MSVDVKIIGQRGKDSTVTEAHVHPFDTATGKHVGLVTLSHRFIETEPSTQFFVNSGVGAAMNQDVSFGGTPEIIHNGGTSTEWTGTALVGAWNFADGGRISVTSANDNDAADFAEENTLTINTNNFQAVTGNIDLTTYSEVNNSMNMQFNLSGTLTGNSVDLNDYIDTTDFAQQNFVIPKLDLGLSTQSVDGMTLTMNRAGGARPTASFDDIQFEETGIPLIFNLNVKQGQKFHISELVFAYADALVGTLSDGTMPALAYDQILGLAALTNGFVITRSKKGKTLFSATIKTLGAHISAGAIPDNPWSDGTNTFVTLRVVFPDPLIITGDVDDTLTIQINDDMTGLLQFTAAARGSIEI